MKIRRNEKPGMKVDIVLEYDTIKTIASRETHKILLFIEELEGAENCRVIQSCNGAFINHAMCVLFAHISDQVGQVQTLQYIDAYMKSNNAKLGMKGVKRGEKHLQ